MKNEIKLGNIKNFIDIEGLNEEDIIIRKQSSEGMMINEDEERTFVATISDTSIDMDGDCVYSKGCDTRTIMKNPVVLWSHSHSSPPVGKIIGLNITDNSIEAKIKMADTVMGRELWELIKGGYLKTNSVGFIIKKAMVKGQKEFGDFVTKSGLQVKDTCKRIISEFTLVENSLCSIPSNENALIEAISTKSIKLDEKLSKELGLVAKEEPKVEAKEEVPVIKVEPKVEQPIIQKPDKAIEEETFKPVFVILRAGDYVPKPEDVKSYKSGKILVM